MTGASTMRALAAALLCTVLGLPAALGQPRSQELDRRMQQIEARLDGMEAQMKRIQGTADPAERQKLLAAHARAWRETAAAVRELSRAFSPQMRAMMGGSERIVSAERMMLAHDLMSRRVSIMERMMEQAMEQSMGHFNPDVPGSAGR